MKNSTCIELPVPLEAVRLHMSMKINVCAWISIGSRAEWCYYRQDIPEDESAAA